MLLPVTLPRVALVQEAPLPVAVALVQEAPVLLLLPLGLPRSLLPVTLPRVVALVHSAPVTVDS